jgi:hypothetical protein
VFWYRLYADGELADEYSSNPEYFSGDRSGNSSGWAGDAGQLCQTFQCPDQTAEVKRILAAPRRDRDTLATRRHQDLVQAIGLPAWSVSTGFQDLAARAALPDGFLDTLGATVSSQN